MCVGMYQQSHKNRLIDNNDIIFYQRKENLSCVWEIRNYGWVRRGGHEFAGQRFEGEHEQKSNVWINNMTILDKKRILENKEEREVIWESMTDSICVYIRAIAIEWQEFPKGSSFWPYKSARIPLQCPSSPEGMAHKDILHWKILYVW